MRATGESKERPHGGELSHPRCHRSEPRAPWAARRLPLSRSQTRKVPPPHHTWGRASECSSPAPLSSCTVDTPRALAAEHHHEALRRYRTWGKAWICSHGYPSSRSGARNTLRACLVAWSDGFEANASTASAGEGSRIRNNHHPPLGRPAPVAGRVVGRSSSSPRRPTWRGTTASRSSPARSDARFQPPRRHRFYSPYCAEVRPR